MKLAIWANSPSPHQSDFYRALRQSGADLKVLYISTVRPERRSIGWQEPASLPEGELFLSQPGAPWDCLPDWRQRVHVIPGYSRLTHLRAAWKLSCAGVPWVHWSESSMPSWRSYLSWPLKRAYAQMVNRHALGAFAQGYCAENDFIKWGISPEKIAHLYYAVDGVPTGTEPDPSTLQFVSDRQAFVFVGTVNKNKSTLMLLKAFAQVGANSDSCLVVVGRGPREDTCRRFVAKQGLSDRVLFRGSLPYDQVGAVLAACHVLVLPSRYDGWGVVMNEAASAGLALIATDAVGAAHHIISHEWNGYRVSTADPQALAAALQVYIENPALSERHGRNSWLRFEQEFTPQANAERLVAAINQWQNTCVIKNMRNAA